jgi:hypothetical protein
MVQNPDDDDDDDEVMRGIKIKMGMKIKMRIKLIRRHLLGVEAREVVFDCYID